MTDEDWMRRAIAAAEEGIRDGQTPFGACVVCEDRLIAAAHNVVWKTTDPTAHAEIAAIRKSSTAVCRIDLSGCTIYSTCEPCPMCFTAIHWSKIGRIVYGASIADAAAAGFNELPISNIDMKRLGGSPLTITPGVLAKESAELFQKWLKSATARRY